MVELQEKDGEEELDEEETQKSSEPHSYVRVEVDSEPKEDFVSVALVPRISGDSLTSEESILEEGGSDRSVGVKLRSDPPDPFNPGGNVGEDESS